MNAYVFRRAITLALLSSAVICGAQTNSAETTGPSQPLDMGAMTVTARGRETLVSQTPGGIGIVDAERAFLDQPLSISDLTRRIPGVSKSGDAHWGAEINIRGMARNRIVFLIDGQRVNTATDVGIQFGLMLPDDIERVEVLKGPVSELYGSGSLGGVVNVITRKGQFSDQPEIHGGLSLSASSNPDGFSSYTRLAYSDKSFWLHVAGGYRDYNSYDDGAHDEVPHSYAEDEQGSLKAGLKWDSANVTEISLSRYYADCIGVPGSEGLPGNATRVVLPRTVMENISLKHSFTPQSDIWEESSLLVYYQKIERDVSIDRFTYAPTAAWPRPYQLWPGAEHTTYGLHWNNLLTIADHSIATGIDAWRWEYNGYRRRQLELPNGSFRFVDDTPMADSSQLVIGLFAEDDWRLNDQFSINVGARVDRVMADSDKLYGPAPANALLRDSSDMDDWSWSAHLGLTWRLNPAWSMTLLGSRAYRVPDIMDRFKYIALSGTSALYGNPNLDPEDSLFLEYGVHYHGDAVSASFSAWVNRVDNLVVAAPHPNNTSDQLMANVDEALLKGLELNAQWRFAPGWTTYGCMAWMEGDNQSTDTYLRDNPPLNGLAGLRYEHNRGWWAECEVEGAAKQDHNAPGYDECDAWLTLNARVGYRFMLGNTSHALLLAATNLANAEYVNYLSSVRGNNSALAYNEPGRNLTLAWKMDF
ncbi:TonB-dependent receptor plug domain-containing protein [Oligosphaera ethanolica]|uniref:Hemoglobin/transferrin/lactoferrin receptor protein n=1 Tax=Oligosphaera ethanolica TaxID=760260 RepID=A0AAE3VIN9_9BACT|nr:TonB-dependent receptor [Oligosphaera ethanolica]MDQ0291125.1 hemoglobin/transferrin/lactoferrin receptor protein [Oligosphaera ethanolica]